MQKEYYIHFTGVEGKWLIHDVQSLEDAHAKAAKVTKDIAIALEIDSPEYEVIELEED